MRLKILIAEDDRHTRRILEHIFTKDPAFADHRIELLQAPDGEEALRLFEKEGPDLVISDLLMPRMDGFALCRNIRKSPRGRDVPLIVTSAIYKETALLNRMRDELRVEFFAKPFQVRELVRGVQRMLDSRLRKDAGPSEVEPTEVERTTDRQEPPVAGHLGDRSLAALMFDMNETQATGVLTLERGRIKKEIYFILGQPTGAESNIRNETMGHYLVVKRILDENQHQRLLATARRENIGVMEALVQLNWLSETDVLRHHTALAKLRIINSLRWRDGTYRFKPGDTFSDRMPKCTIDPVTIVLLGLKRLTIPDEVSVWLQQDIHRPLKLTPRGERFREQFSQVYGDALLTVIANQPSLSDLMAKGLDPLLLYTHAYALIQTGMAELGDRAAPSASPSVRTEDPLTLEQLKQHAVPTRTPPDQSAVLHQKLFGVDEISVVTAIPTPRPSRREGGEDSAVVEIPISVEIAADAATPEPGLTADQARQRVVSTYLGIHSKNYYEILSLPEHADTGQIRKAYEKLKARFDPEAISLLDLGTDHPKLEELLHLFRQAYHVLSDPSLRADYDRRLATDRRARQPDPLEAELLFREGELRLKQGDFEQAKDCFKQALAMDPDAADYHSHLGWAIYKAAPAGVRVLDEVWSHLNRALDLDPDLVSAHFHAGLVHADAGAFQKANEHLEKVLDLDPANERAFSLLRSLLEDRGDWRILERLHRKVLHRLGSRFPEWTLKLWKNLADVYHHRLNNPDSARVCLEIASKLKPDDDEVQRILASLMQPEPQNWHERRSLFLEQLEATGRTQLLGALFEAAISQKLHDEAYLCAACLVALNAETTAATECYRRFRPPFLLRARAVCDATIWNSIRHEDDDPHAGRIFEVLADLPQHFDLGMPPAGRPSAQEVDPSAHANHFGRVLEYLCHQLGIPVPRVRVMDDIEGLAATPSRPLGPDLAVSRRLLEERDHLRLAAVLGLALPFFREGRWFGALYSQTELKSLVMATMLLVAPKLKVDDPDGTISKLTDGLKNVPPPLKQRLSDTIIALTKQRSTLNVGRWYSALHRTAERFSATLVGDINPVLSAIPENRRRNSILPLVSYALGDNHVQVRERLGLSIAV